MEERFKAGDVVQHKITGIVAIIEKIDYQNNTLMGFKASRDIVIGNDIGDWIKYEVEEV